MSLSYFSQTNTHAHTLFNELYSCTHQNFYGASTAEEEAEAAASCWAEHFIDILDGI